MLLAPTLRSLNMWNRPRALTTLRSRHDDGYLGQKGSPSLPCGARVTQEVETSSVMLPGFGVSSQPPWTENRPSKRWLPRLDLRELWSSRELALILALKTLKVRYKQTAVGVAWVLLQPLLGVAIFTVFLGRLAGLESESGVAYPLFVFTGLIMWLYIAGAVSAAAASLFEQRELLTKIYFPRLLAPVAAVIAPLMDLAVSLAIATIFIVWYDARPTFALLLLPLWIAAALLLAFAVGAWLAALNVKYRDVRHALPFFLQVWFFASPVVFATSVVDERWRYVYALNPAVGIIDGFRWSLASGPRPGAYALVSLGATLLILVVGVVYFRRVERYIADIA
jgi:lipopolysaccharide transport system permease protein